MDALLDDALAYPVRFFEDLPALLVIWLVYLRPFHRKLLATDALILRRQESINRNQKKLAEAAGVELEPTGAFPAPNGEHPPMH